MLNTDLVERLNDGSDRRFRVLLAVMVGLAITNAIVPTGYDWSVLPGDSVTGAQDLKKAGAGGSWAKRLQWLPLYLIALYVIWIRRGLAVMLLPSLNPFLLLFTVWATLSVVWSADPAATIRRIVQVWGLILIAFAFCLSAWHPDRLVNVVRGTYSCMMFASLFFCLFIPFYGLHQSGEYDGAWRGITLHKNSMGGLAAIGFMIWVHALAGRRVVWYRALPMIGLAGLLLVMAQSSTSILIAGTAAPAIWIMSRPPVASEGWLAKMVLISMLTFALPLFLLVLAYGMPTFADILAPIAQLFGKDVTLTGRSDIWELMWAEIARHPVQGVGFGAFWLGLEGPSGIIMQELNFYPAQAHNGYLDVLNETGIVGLIFALLFLVVHFVHVVRSGFDKANMAFFLVTLFVMVAWNMTESSLFRPISTMLVLSIIMSLAVSRARSVLGPDNSLEATRFRVTASRRAAVP